MRVLTFFDLNFLLTAFRDIAEGKLVLNKVHELINFDLLPSDILKCRIWIIKVSQNTCRTHWTKSCKSAFEDKCHRRSIQARPKNQLTFHNSSEIIAKASRTERIFSKVWNKQNLSWIKFLTRRIRVYHPDKQKSPPIRETSREIIRTWSWGRNSWYLRFSKSHR